MLCSLSTKLDEKTLDAIKHLEKELDKTLLAFSCHPAKPAEISNEQLAMIQRVEKELDLSLIAVSKQN